MRARAMLLPWLVLPALGCGPSAEDRAKGVAAFATVQQVFQHPRCQNCHIPGDAPLQLDAGVPHGMAVTRGADGDGPPGLPCASCHGSDNPPASYGPNAPPGAPRWMLPPADQKMVFIGLSPTELCQAIQDKSRNGGRDLAAVLTHVSEDKLVLWGWSPGGERAAVPVAHDQFVASFKLWAEAGAPCP